MSGDTVLKERIAQGRIVQVGLTRNDRHEYFLDGRGPVPSVTTILKVIDKSGPLIGWAKRITAEAAIDHRTDLEEWVKLGGREGAVSFLTKASDALRDRAATTGSEIHAIAESIALGNTPEISEAQRPYVEAYLAWKADFEPEFLATEEMVYSAKGYAGTLDAIVRMSGETWLIDYKTSKGVYAETACQLAAYANADFIGRPGMAQRFAIPPIDQYGVLHLRPEGYELVPFDLTGAWEAFCAAMNLAAWKSSEASVGRPVGPALVKFQAPAKEALA